MGHPGIQRWYRSIHPWFYTKNLKLIIETFRKDCITCQRYSSALPRYGRIGGSLQTNEPLKHLASDILGPLDSFHFKGETESHKFYIITIIDRCTRWIDLKITRRITQKQVRQALEQWISKRGKPTDILTDNGTQYVSKELQQYLHDQNIEQILTVPYNPQSNGIAERINATTTKCLGMHSNLTLKEAVKQTIFALNNTAHQALGCSPQ